MPRKASGKYVYKDGDHKHPHTWRNCSHCGADYLGRVDSNSRYCSLRCAGKANGKQPRPSATQPGHLVCTKCGEEKPADAFPRHAQSDSGRKPRCRACYAEDWVTTRSPEILARRREYGRTRVLTEEQTERRRKYLAQYAEANRERRAAYHQAWAEANREARRNSQGRRRARIFASTVTCITVDQLRAKWDYWAGRCWMCSEPAVHWDHVKPLSKGGGHILSNLRPACAPCNLRKHDRWPYAYHKH